MRRSGSWSDWSESSPAGEERGRGDDVHRVLKGENGAEQPSTWHEFDNHRPLPLQRLLASFQSPASSIIRPVPEQHCLLGIRFQRLSRKLALEDVVDSRGGVPINST